jgi:hypothetical protein
MSARQMSSALVRIACRSTTSGRSSTFTARDAGEVQQIVDQPGFQFDVAAQQPDVLPCGPR